MSSHKSVALIGRKGAGLRVFLGLTIYLHDINHWLYTRPRYYETPLLERRMLQVPSVHGFASYASCMLGSGRKPYSSLSILTVSKSIQAKGKTHHLKHEDPIAANPYSAIAVQPLHHAIPAGLQWCPSSHGLVPHGADMLAAVHHLVGLSWSNHFLLPHGFETMVHQQLT